jgi:hypothetical protein
VLAVKAGRVPEGAKAAMSHTGAMQGTAELFGTIRKDDRSTQQMARKTGWKVVCSAQEKQLCSTTLDKRHRVGLPDRCSAEPKERPTSQGAEPQPRRGELRLKGRTQELL